MNRDKKLYNLMIKNHPTIVGWFIYKGVVGKKDDGLYIVNDNEEEDWSPKLPNENAYQVYETYSDGVRRINANRWNKAFSQIELNHKKIKDYSFRTLIDAGFPIFDIGNTSDRFCFTHQIEDIINSFPDLVLDIHFPEDYKRMTGKSIESFMKFTQNQIDFVRSNGNLFTGYRSFNYSFIGAQIGFSDNAPDKIANINRYGIFANRNIYKFLEWNFDLVEKYKDQIIWERLMDDSNLLWEEEMLVKYDKYIPYQKYENGPKYSYDDNSSRRLENYKKLGFLSNSFLREHIDVLDWEKVLEKCKFSWNKEDLEFFCRYALNHDEKYTSTQTIFISGRPICDVEAILNNEYFEWDVDKLYAYLQLDDDFWNSIQENKKLHKIFMQIPNVREIAQPYIKDDKFWDIVSYDHCFDYDELSKEFTIDNIKRNIDNWSIPLKNKFLSMHRTPDTNYYYYRAINQWDIYWDRKNIPLTYDLAKYLSTIDIKVGGTYMESDGGYMEEDHRFPVFNGLEAFSSHHIDSKADMDKIIEDEDVANILLAYNNSINLDLLYYVIGIFFKDFPLKEYIDVINQLKDSDAIKEFYGDEEKFNSFDDKDWDRLMKSILIM